jgi:hypothetical protein
MSGGGRSVRLACAVCYLVGDDYYCVSLAPEANAVNRAVILVSLILILPLTGCVQDWPLPSNNNSGYCGDGLCNCSQENWGDCPQDCPYCVVCPNNLPWDNSCHDETCCEAGNGAGQDAECCGGGYCVIWNVVGMSVATQNCGQCGNNCMTWETCRNGVCERISGSP